MSAQCNRVICVTILLGLLFPSGFSVKAVQRTPTPAVSGSIYLPIVQTLPWAVKVAAGDSHTCALTAEGGVWCWGSNQYGQLGNGTTQFRPVPTPVSGLQSGVKDISSSWGHSCALTITGGVKCWGKDYSNTPQDVSGWESGITALSTGGGLTCVLTAAGSVMCDPDIGGISNGAAAISAGMGHVCALMQSGRVKCWGNNSSGQLGDGTTNWSSIPVNIAGQDRPAIAIAAGYNHTCAILEGGSAICWGWNNWGQVGNGNPPQDVLTPQQVSGVSSGVTAISAGGGHTCALLQTGAVKCWGSGKYGQMGNGTEIGGSIPLDVSGLEESVIVLSAGDNHTCALTGGHGIICWGLNDSGQLGFGQGGPAYTPMPVVSLDRSATTVRAGRGHTCVLEAGNVKCWGENSSGQLGDGTLSNRYAPVDVSGLTSEAVDLATGNSHTCVLTTSKGIQCWGGNYTGQLGDGTTNSRSTPAKVQGLHQGVKNLTAGEGHSCALIEGGAAECWGNNGYGQLGDGSFTDRHIPVSVQRLSSGIIVLSAIENHTCALTIAGGVKCWGDNFFGQLGDGTTTNRNEPVDVQGLPNGAIFIGGGNDFTCAILTGGGAKCWGAGFGPTPVDAPKYADAFNFSAGGGRFSCKQSNIPEALGGVKCWGQNEVGQLGNGTNVDSSIPVDVSGLTGQVVVGSLTSGGGHSCAQTWGGDILCWGSNYAGQLGNGSGPAQAIPVNVIGFGW